MEADTESDLPVSGNLSMALEHAALDFDGTAARLPRPLNPRRLAMDTVFQPLLIVTNNSFVTAFQPRCTLLLASRVISKVGISRQRYWWLGERSAFRRHGAASGVAAS